MIDYTWPSIFLAYFLFFICLVLAVFFCIRSIKDGYWTKEGEDIRFQVFEGDAPPSEPRPAAGEREGNSQAEPPAPPLAGRRLEKVGQAVPPANGSGVSSTRPHQEETSHAAR